jgi:hypothetical protein
MKRIFEEAFPSLFIWGYPFTEKGMITIEQIRHMLHQASNMFSNNFEIVSYLHNMNKRRQTAYGVNIAFRNDPETVEKFRNAYEDPKFKKNLEYCIKNPKSKEAKEIESWLIKLVNKSVKGVQFR